MSYTKDQARTEIADLVANFRANERSLADVPEAQIEGNYIRKLFHFLNWNTENTGLSVTEWEFVLQRTDEKGKRPDYVLQLDGQQVLVMDAKKVKYDMHASLWMKQVYAYAYSTQSQPVSRKIDFAILTDFQEFILLDCTLYAADTRAVSNFRILDWTYEDYVSQFDMLWELFERENVRAALKTRGTETASSLWARYLSPKKVKANRIPPDKTFLAKMDDENTGWRVRLAKDMKKRNPQADGALITAAVQLLIDRLIFVKALSDREIEADYLTQLAEQVEKSGLDADDAGWFNACRDIFTRLNQFYNGSIFEPRPELEAVTVSNKVVRGVIHDLQPENSPYNFAVLPVEILGTIYERFLGRVVRATDQRVKIEDKPEVRKAGGVYYTPQYIVDYIVENTVGKLLSECKTPADVTRLKILDPACGSGSFLLGAYSALIRWHEAYYSDKERLTQRDHEAAYYDSDGRVRLTARLKRQILLNNLYGVDIDAQAVEVTRFSLSLKALEDTRRAELYEERTLFRQTVLPDLRQNIKCGNSLIGPDYFTGQMFTDHAELLRVNPFDWGTEFSQIMAAGGFDAVIGNPPYVFTRNEGFTESEKAYFYKHFLHQSVQLNTFGLFTEQVFRLLREGGSMGFITPNNWLTIDTFAPLREFIISKTGNLSIINILDRVFEAANVDTAITLCSKVNPSTLKVAEMQDKLITNSHEVSLGLIKPPAYIIQISLLKDSKSQLILDKIERQAKGLGELCTVSTGLKAYQIGKGKPSQTQREKANRVFHNIKPINKTYGRYLNGIDVRRYQIEWSGTYLSYGDWLAEPRKSVPFKGPRILVRQIPSKPPYLVHGIFTDEQFYNDINSMVVFSPTSEYSLNYFLGLINSRLLSFWFQKMYDKLQRKIFPQFKVKELGSFPVRPINFSDPADKARHNRMVRLVESMLELHKYKATVKIQALQNQIQRQIIATDRQVDELVYELYGLTPDEIAVVEGQK